MPWCSFTGRSAAVGNDKYHEKGIAMDGQRLLNRIYLFAEATDVDVASLIGIATPKKYRQGEFVFNEGDEADAIFVVEMGTVDMVPTGKEMAIVTIGSAQAFGEIAFFRRGKRPGSARAREASTILRIPFDGLEKLLVERPEFALSFYRNACGFMAKHLRTLIKDVDRRYF
ncbi:MAG TPA: cyclic nucleotide-binding domain-containing protein [Candidatus Binatia bacterium]|jgi:CRP-like cAMP-binding protein